MNSSQEDPISVTIMKRRLMEAGLGGRIAARKPFLWSTNKKERLQWAKQHEQLTVGDWKCVLWTNESKSQIFGSKRRVFVQRKIGEQLMKVCGASCKIWWK